MSDYAQYIKSAGITGTAFTRSVRESFPAFSKITKSMVCHPERYGMMLTPEAEGKLLRDFGEHPGLSPAAKAVKPKPHAVSRTKPNRLVVYLPDDTNEKLRDMMTSRGYKTVQDFLFCVLTNLVEIEERRIRENAE